MYIRQYTSRPSFGLGSLTAPFEGTFVGTIAGDASSKAAVSVTLRQQGSAVEGEIALGAGLQFDFGGVCGLEPIDLRSIPIKGQTAAENPMKFTATTEIREPTTKFGATHVVATLSITAILKSDGQSGTGTIVVTPMRAEPRLPPKPLIGCKPVTRELTLTKQTAAPSAPLQGLGLTPAQNWTDPWKDLLLFVPPVDVQKKIRSKCALTIGSTCGVYWGFNKIGNAFGPANLDFYSVHVSKPPTLKRVVLGPDALLSHIRTNLNIFMDPNRMMFRQWDTTEDKLWRSNNPLGAIMRLDFYMGWRNMAGNVDDGTVVVSDYSAQRWRVYTVWNLSDHGHPVSGAREWGHAPADGGGFLIYTRGADRLTKSWMLNPVLQNAAYNAQRAVWNFFQKRIVDFVNGHGGAATIGSSSDRREDWPVLTGRYGTPQGWLP